MGYISQQQIERLSKLANQSGYEFCLPPMGNRIDSCFYFINDKDNNKLTKFMSKIKKENLEYFFDSIDGKDFLVIGNKNGRYR